MEQYIERIKKDAEHLVKEVFPTKALELDSVLNKTTFDSTKISSIHDKNEFPNPEDYLHVFSSNNEKIKEKENQDEDKQHYSSKKRKFEHVNKTDAADVPGCKVILFPNGSVASNQNIMELINIIKPYVVHLLDSTATLKLWIQILIPKVEDFKAEISLQIQEDSLSEIRAVEAEVATYLDHIYKYHTVRGKFISKLYKYPHVGDYKQSVIELDEKMFMTIRLIALELRNHYTTVHDILMKNLEKIKKPRTHSDISMY